MNRSVNDWGYIEVDPVTSRPRCPVSMPVVTWSTTGPSSIVKAVAAGKAIADSILRRRHPARDGAGRHVRSGDAAAAAQPPGMAGTCTSDTARDRDNFNEVVLTYDEQQARTEAARCLDCDAYCSVCVGVCPNLALQTYETAPFEVRLPH